MDGNLVVLGDGDQGVSVPFDAEVRGSAGAETVTVPTGADVAFSANSGDTVALPGALADFSVAQQGNAIVFESGGEDGTRAVVRLNADVDIQFSDGTATAAFNRDVTPPQIELGGEPVDESFDPANVDLSGNTGSGTSGAGGDGAGGDGSTDGGSDAGESGGGDDGGNEVFLGGGAQTVTLPFDAEVTGTADAETVQVANGAQVSFDGGGEDRIAFTGNLAEFKLESSGNTLTVSNGETEAEISVNGKVEIAFADGAAEADIDTQGEGPPTVTLGGEAVGPDFDPMQVKLDAKAAAKFGGKGGEDTEDGGLPPLPSAGGPAPVQSGTKASENIDGNQDGATLSGSGGDDRFILQQEVTTVTIDDFNSGDQLFFGDGMTANDVAVTNKSFTDGSVTVTAGEAAATITNLGGDADSRIIDPTTFESTIGGNALGFAGDSGSGGDSGTTEETAPADGDTKDDAGGSGDDAAMPQTLTGTDGDDDLEGGDAGDTINGGAGNDELDGDGGADTIDGGVGDDDIEGDSGDDELTGGAGADTFSFELEADADTASGGTDGSGGTSGSGDANAFLAARAMGPAGTNGPNNLVGTKGADTLDGGNGPDTLRGLAGDDELLGGNGPDILAGGAGADTLTGGNGPTNFSFAAGDGKDVVTDFFAPTDTLVFNLGDDDGDDDGESSGDETGGTDDGSADDGSSGGTTSGDGTSSDGTSSDDGSTSDESGDTDDDDGEDDDGEDDDGDGLELPDGVTAADGEAGVVLSYDGGSVTLQGVSLSDLGEGNVTTTDDPLSDIGGDEREDDEDEAENEDETESETETGDETGDDGSGETGDDAGSAGHGSDTITDFELGTDTVELTDAPDGFTLDDVTVTEVTGDDGETDGVTLSHPNGEITVLGGEVTAETPLADYATIA